MSQGMSPNKRARAATSDPVTGALGMEQTWRWYGPNDPVTLAHIKQAGATGIVTALHEVPIGEVWSVADICERKRLIEASGLSWSVAESIPVHETIKQGVEPQRTRYIDNYKASIANLGACGIRILCYNFMPVIDWTRTDLDFEWSDGSHALAFDLVSFAAFELHILQRPGAEARYPPPMIKRAAARYASMSAADREALSRTVTAGMPGRMVDALTLDQFRTALAAYADIDDEHLRQHLRHFLLAVVPAAAEAGVYMALHPDDPPMPLLGLPRVVSTDADIQYVLQSVDSAHNGLCFCVGSYASNEGNRVEEMAERHAGRTNFVHLRNVRRTDGDGSFVESDHLDGEVDMFRVVRTFAREAARRQAAGGMQRPLLPFRPDHGHKMLDDLEESKHTNPGYTAIGRLRGLAELRGLQEAILRYENGAAMPGSS